MGPAPSGLGRNAEVRDWDTARRRRPEYHQSKFAREEAEMAVAHETFQHLTTAGLADVDPQIAELLGKELERQRGQIELIASENFTWPSVLEAVRSVPTNKYAEGYPGKRYYGGSAYPRTVETWEFRKIADEVDALLLCDMAHYAGLVAAGLHPNPVEDCDFVTSTTHKTLAGPRSGFILCKEEHATAVDRAVFPGMQGGPLEHAIAAKATCFKIAMTDAFRDYQAQIRRNADTLSETLIDGGLDVLTGGTDTHLLQLDLRSTDWTGKEAEERLAEVKLTVNRNTVPFDERPPTVASGVRIGTPAATMRGFDEPDFREVGQVIVEALGASPDLGALAARSEALCAKRPLYPGFRGFTTYVA